MRINVVIEGHAYPAQVPEDMKIADFIDEIRDQMGLAEGGWVLRDKNGRHPLDPQKTLEDNGVIEGQNIFAERSAPARRVDLGKPVPVPIPEEPVIPAMTAPPALTQRSRTRWITLPVAFVVIAASFAMLGYALANASGTGAERDLARARAELQKLQQNASSGQQNTTQLRDTTQKLNEERSQLLEQLAKATSEITTLQQRVASLSKDAARSKFMTSEVDTALTKARTEIETLRHDGDQAKSRLDAALKAQREAETRANEAIAVIRRLENQTAEIKTARQRPWSVLRWRVDKLKSGSLVDIYRTRAAAGEISVVYGDVPVGAPSRVFVGNPEIAEVRVQPSATDQFSRIQLLLKKSGRQEVLLFWAPL